jgi:hypothetical protein
LRCGKCGWLLRLNYLFCWRHASCQTDIIVFSSEYWLPTANGSCGAPRAGPHFGCVVRRERRSHIHFYLFNKIRIGGDDQARVKLPLADATSFFFFLSSCIARNTWTNLPHDDWHQSDNWIHRIPYIQSDSPCFSFTDLFIKKKNLASPQILGKYWQLGKCRWC